LKVNTFQSSKTSDLAKALIAINVSGRPQGWLDEDLIRRVSVQADVRRVDTGQHFFDIRSQAARLAGIKKIN